MSALHSCSPILSCYASCKQFSKATPCWRPREIDQQEGRPSVCHLYLQPNQRRLLQLRPKLVSDPSPELQQQCHSTLCALSLSPAEASTTISTSSGLHQLSQNLTTWVEDSVSLRSDCHAWGCVPIYKFLKEVCGVRVEGVENPTLVFEPRMSLFPALEAKVPFSSGRVISVAHVKWKRVDDGDIRLEVVPRTLEGDMVDIPVRVVPPDGYVQAVPNGDKTSLLFKLEK